MSSPEPRPDLQLDRPAASRGLGCGALAGIALFSLLVSVLGIFIERSPILWLEGLLGGGGGSAFIPAVLIGAVFIFIVLFFLFRVLLK